MPGWSFADHPQPPYKELTKAEQKALDDSGRDHRDFEILCRGPMAVAYDIYQDRYPAFLRIADAATRERHWRTHLVAIGRAPHLCFIWDLARIRIPAAQKRLGAFSRFRFCGRYAQAPANDAERHLAGLVDELFAYAATGNYSAIRAFPGHANDDNRLALGPDILYYLYAIAWPTSPAFEKRWNEHQQRKLVYLTRYFSSGRRAFVDAAVRRRDLAAVVATTGPCKAPGTYTFHR